MINSCLKINRFGLYVVAVLASLLISLGQASAQEEVRINFRDADIRSVIESVAEITGKSFVLDPRVKGKVTIIAPQPIDSRLLYEAVLSAIQVQGFQAVRDGAVTRIIPFSQAFNFAAGDGGNQMRTEVLRIKHVQAATLVSVLKPMLSNGARLMAYAPSNYLVVSDIETNILQLKRFIEIMDDPDSSAVEVVNLRHISAAEAVHIASQLKQLQKQELSLVEDGLNDRIIVSGPGIARASFKAMLLNLDVPSAKQASVEVMYLDFLRAAEIKPVIDGMLQSDTFLRLAGQSGGDGKNKTNYKIEIDELNNALILAAPREVIREVNKVLDQLDKPRPQVLIEAVIAELSEDQAEDLSSQLIYSSKNRGAYLTNFDGVLTSLLGTTLLEGSQNTSPSMLSQGLPAAGLGVLGDFDNATGKGMGLLVQALKTDGATKVLSTPSVVTLDNEEATLTVGEEVPFQTGSFTNSNNVSTNPFTTINREEVGVTLKVKPQISKGDAVRLEIEQESSKVQAGGTVGLQTTSKTTMQTNVMVQDGELLVLGGLIEDTGSDNARKVPIIGDIPLLGRFFRATKNESKQRVMMMFIRPTILRDPLDAKTATKGRFDHLILRDLDGDTPGYLTPKLKELE
ncbi:MAG: type II secretion system protein GspD [Porticoccaceae bacterium]|mgnify:FL=1|nr:type II secretion system protein GspD [Porticoccaceae bacterium]|tara:strand:- start:18623 stop:20503 length:1881 start_codon:yes stop_codon:yes gene_type:complete